MEYIDIKTVYLKIQNDYLYEQITDYLLAEINNRYYELFKYCDLEDLQFRLFVDNNIIVFNPIRTIDKFLIAHILG